MPGKLNNLDVNILYDPGSMITIVNSALVSVSANKQMTKILFTTLSGKGYLSGLANVSLRIGIIEKKVKVYLSNDQRYWLNDHDIFTLFFYTDTHT